MKQRSASNLQLITWLGGAALGAAAIVYWTDPVQGRRRRAIAQEKMRSMTHKTGDAINAVMQDAGNRLSDMQARANRVIHNKSAKPIDDHVLAARVNAKIGRSLSNAHAIDVTAQRGCITLKGPILADEKAYLISLVHAIPGVTDVKDRLAVYDDETLGHRQQKDWTPTRIMAMLGGGALGYYGMTRRSPSSMLLATIGLGLLARNVSIADLKRLFGMVTDTQGVMVEKIIQINASPETVFDVWNKYENFPQFMSDVVEVSDLGQGRSHWIVKGPAGATVEWNAVLTEVTRPTYMAWQSEPGATVINAGSVYLEPADGGTRATVRLSYSPPAGVLGKTVAMLLGSDPEQQLEDDLIRMKNFIEGGAPRQDSKVAIAASNQLLH